MIQLEHVSKFVLKDVNLYIPQGKAVGLIGKSGAGKTTMLKLISGLLSPDEGRVSTLGHCPVKYRKKYGRDISAFFAGIPLLEPEESVRCGFEMIAAVYGMSKTEYQSTYAELAQALGFGRYEEQKGKDLSLGQRMRAELGATLLYSPSLLLLDEPTIGLDQEAKEVFRELLQAKVREGMTLVVSSHDMNEVSHLCDRLAVLHKGKLVFYGDESGLHRRQNSLQTMKIRIDGAFPDLGDIPFCQYTVENDLLTITYSSNYITSAEILRQIMNQTTIGEFVIRGADLGEAISQSFE